MGHNREDKSMLKHTYKAIKCFENTTMNCGAILNRVNSLIFSSLRMRIAPCLAEMPLALQHGE